MTNHSRVSSSMLAPKWRVVLLCQRSEGVLVACCSASIGRPWLTGQCEAVTEGHEAAQTIS